MPNEPLVEAERLFKRNFQVALSLLDLYEAFQGMNSGAPPEGLRTSLCQYLEAQPHEVQLQHVRGPEVALFATRVFQIFDAFTRPCGLDFLLRQAVVVACTSLDAFYFDVIRESALAVVRAGAWRKDKKFREMTFTLQEFYSMESVGVEKTPENRDEQYRKLFEMKFERGSLANEEAISDIGRLFGVDKFWERVVPGRKDSEVRKELNDLVNRRNRIAHRADRPRLGEEADQVGLFPIDFGWVYRHVHAIKPLVAASVRLFRPAISRMEAEIQSAREQEEARRLLAQDPDDTPSTPLAPPGSTSNT